MYSFCRKIQLTVNNINNEQTNGHKGLLSTFMPTFCFGIIRNLDSLLVRQHVQLSTSSKILTVL